MAIALPRRNARRVPEARKPVRGDVLRHVDLLRVNLVIKGRVRYK